MTRRRHPAVGSLVSYTGRSHPFRWFTFGRRERAPSAYFDHWPANRGADWPAARRELLLEAAATAGRHPAFTQGRGVLDLPEDGTGILVGITRRAVGATGNDDGQPFTSGRMRSLYQVKTSLGGATILVPTSALQVIAPPPAMPEAPPAPDPNQMALA